MIVFTKFVIAYNSPEIEEIEAFDIDDYEVEEDENGTQWIYDDEEDAWYYYDEEDDSWVLYDSELDEEEEEE